MKHTIKTELIENYIKENKLSKTSFCKLCKISTSTLKKIYENDDNFRTIALLKIAIVLKIAICELFSE